MRRYFALLVPPKRGAEFVERHCVVDFRRELFHVVGSRFPFDFDLAEKHVSPVFTLADEYVAKVSTGSQ
jgi:hypothetical protein